LNIEHEDVPFIKIRVLILLKEMTIPSGQGRWICT